MKIIIVKDKSGNLLETNKSEATRINEKGESWKTWLCRPKGTKGPWKEKKVHELKVVKK